MIVNSKILKTASVLSLLAAAAFSGVAGAAESADASPVFQEGTYVLKMGKKFLGHDVYFDLRNGGDTIDLPRGEFTLKKNEQGVHVNGCFSMYRGAEVIVDRQCGYKGGQIYCRTVPDWVEVQPGNEELNNIEEVIEVFISPVERTVRANAVRPSKSCVYQLIVTELFSGVQMKKIRRAVLSGCGF